MIRIQEDDGPSGLRQVHCTCGVVCSRAVKAAMREVERAADRAEKTQLAQISERLLENTQVRRFLTASFAMCCIHRDSGLVNALWPCCATKPELPANARKVDRASQGLA
eukprot:g31099.t1